MNLGSACEPGWHLFANRCYHFSSEFKKGTSAEKYCVDRGSHLASIHSDVEMQFVSNLMTRHAWIGLEWKDNSHQWTDGSAFDFNNWRQGDPSSSGSQNCVFIHGPFNDGYHGYWHDIECGFTYAAPICKKNWKGND